MEALSVDRSAARLSAEAQEDATVPIRPCMVSFYSHPDYSGSSIQAFNLSRHLVGRGLRPFIVAANLSGSAPEDEFEGIPLFRIPVLKPKELQIPSFGASLMRFLIARRRDFDVIHAHGTLPHAVASLAGRLLGKPTLLKVAMAESDIAFGRQGRLRGRVNRALVSRFDAYVATTDAIVQEFAQEGLNSSRVRYIPNGVDADVFKPAPEASRASLRRDLSLPDGPLVAYVGIIKGRKNVDGMLRIWQSVCAQDSRSHLMLLGPTSSSDPFFLQLQTFVREAGLSARVSFLGHRTPVVPYLQAADLFLFPSRREGMANSVLEAMSCGLPCIVSRSAGVGSVIDDGVNGFALDADDENGSAQLLSELIADSERRARIGGEARRTVISRFSLAATADRYCDLYRELIRGTTA